MIKYGQIWTQALHQILLLASGAYFIGWRGFKMLSWHVDETLTWCLSAAKWAFHEGNACLTLVAGVKKSNFSLSECHVLRYGVRQHHCHHRHLSNGQEQGVWHTASAADQRCRVSANIKLLPHKVISLIKVTKWNWDKPILYFASWSCWQKIRLWVQETCFYFLLLLLVLSVHFLTETAKTGRPSRNRLHKCLAADLHEAASLKL